MMRLLEDLSSSVLGGSLCGSVSFCLSLGSGALVGPSCSAGVPCSEGCKRQDPESKAPSSWQLLLSAKKIQRMGWGEVIQPKAADTI